MKIDLAETLVYFATFVMAAGSLIFGVGLTGMLGFSSLEQHFSIAAFALGLGMVIIAIKWIREEGSYRVHLLKQEMQEIEK